MKKENNLQLSPSDKRIVEYCKANGKKYFFQPIEYRFNNSTTTTRYHDIIFNDYTECKNYIIERIKIRGLQYKITRTKIVDNNEGNWVIRVVELADYIEVL